MQTDNATGQDVRYLVNPVSLADCVARFIGPAVGPTEGVAVHSEKSRDARILDISFLRVVIEDCEASKTLVTSQQQRLEFCLNPIRFTADVTVWSQGSNWWRLNFDKLVPSSHAHLRSFLRPKKVGESILQDVATETSSHYHGLNETEVWTDSKARILFTYLDPHEPAMQFLVRITDEKNSLRVGRIARSDYISLDSLENDIALVPLTDREMYSKLGECRDIITNIRPVGSSDYVLKQRLLKAVSDTLYSTGKRVDLTANRPSQGISLPGGG